MAKWDIGRFLNTVNYFEAIPIVSDMRRWLGSKSGSQSSIDGSRALGVILVIGASGELGEAIVRQLHDSGYRVRAAIADLSLAPFNVPASVEFVQSPFSLPVPDSIAIERAMADVRSIVICPNELGILSTTDVEAIATAVRSYLPTTRQLQLFDFTRPDRESIARWGAIDDVVMGGVSESGLRLVDGGAMFSGNVSIENSGGFASVRTRNFDPSLNLSNYQGIELRVKGDGQRYKFFVRTEASWDGVGYAYSFDPIANEWTTIQIPFRDLVPIFRAKTVKNAAPIETDRIHSFQVMLSKFEYDGALNPHFAPGLFSLHIATIAAYGGKTLPQLIAIGRAPISDNLAPQLQATNLSYSIVQWGNLDAQMVANIAVRSIDRPEAVGQILGR